MKYLEILKVIATNLQISDSNFKTQNKKKTVERCDLDINIKKLDQTNQDSDNSLDSGSESSTSSSGRRRRRCIIS